MIASYASERRRSSAPTPEAVVSFHAFSSAHKVAKSLTMMFDHDDASYRV